jgi:hypothetical protein
MYISRSELPQLPGQTRGEPWRHLPRGNTHIPISPPKARAKPFSLLCLLLSVGCHVHTSALSRKLHLERRVDSVEWIDEWQCNEIDNEIVS